MVPRTYHEEPDRLVLLQAAGLVLLVLIAYLPAFHAGFIWDDDRFLTGNPLIRAADGLKGFWCSTAAPDYWPITSSSLWLEWRLWGPSPTGYHVTNVLLHAGSVILVWRILRALGMPGAFLAAVLVAVHPLNAESVVWITQRKNLLAMLFALLSVDAFIRERRVWSLVAFTLAMLSKGSAAFIPLVMVGVLFSRRQLHGRNLAWLGGYFAVSATFTGVNVWFQAIHYLPRHIDPLTRLMLAGESWGFYLEKALLPVGLAFVYPQWHSSLDSFLSWAPSILFAGVTIGLIRLWKRGYHVPLYGWAFFAVALIPVLGLADTAFMIHAPVSNHYAHFAVIGVAATAGWAFAQAWLRWPGLSLRLPLAVAAVAVTTWYSCLTWRQAVVYGNPRTLYEDSLASNPDSWMVQNNLGVVLSSQGDSARAEAHFIQAIRLKDDFAEAHFNYGNCLSARGEMGRALEEYQRAGTLAQQNPQFSERTLSLVGEGGVALRKRDLGLAILCFRGAIALSPRGAADPECDLGIALLESGKTQEAIGHFETSVQLQPNSAPMRNDLGNAYLMLGRYEEAIVQLRAAVELRPEDKKARYNLAVALRRAGKDAEAAQVPR